MRNQLSHKLMYQLTQLVEAQYVERNESDRVFAIYAQATLGFPVSEGNIAGARKTLDIPATLHRTKREADNLKESVAAHTDQLTLIFKRLDALEALARAAKLIK